MTIKDIVILILAAAAFVLFRSEIVPTHSSGLFDCRSHFNARICSPVLMHGTKKHHELIENCAADQRRKSKSSHLEQ
jgi:hypothetical protein